MIESPKNGDEFGAVFLARMSHELRTPLNAVLGYAQLLEMGDLSDAQRRSVHQIERAGRQLLRLVDEALEIVRLDSEEQTLSLEPVDVIALVRRALDLVAPLAKERRIEISESIAQPVYALADEQRFSVVLLNLLSNAVAYNREGGRVEVAAEEHRGRVRVSVRDTGPGLTQEQVSRLFVAFERLGADQLGIAGAGLGLTLAKRLTEAMAGTIGVESEPGTGSTFWIELAPASVDAERGPESVAVRSGGSQHRPAKTILYIEDNLMNLALVAELVAMRPEIALITSVQGRLGIELARQHRPDLILLDLHLPDMSGREVLAALKADECTAALSVVVLSSDAFPDNRVQLLGAGANGYLTKPLDLHAFLELLDGLLT